MGKFSKSLVTTKRRFFTTRRYLEIKIKSLGGARYEINIATVLEQQGKIEEALKLYQEALETMIQAVGPSYVSVAKTKKNIWTVYDSNYEVNTNDEAGLARQYYQEACAITGSRLMLTTLTPEALFDSFKCGHRGCFTV